MSNTYEDGEIEVSTETIGKPDTLRAGLPDEQPRTRRWLLRAVRDAGRAAVPVVVAVSGGANLIQLEHARQLERANRTLKEQLAARGETDALTRITTAERYWSAFNTIGVAAGDNSGEQPLSDSRRTTTLAIARGIAADPGLSANPLAAFRYACDTMHAWGVATYPNIYGGTPTDLFDEDVVIAFGLAFREPSTVKDWDTERSFELLESLRAANVFFGDLSFYATDAEQAQRSGEDIRGATVRYLQRTGADTETIVDVATTPEIATDGLNNLLLHRVSECVGQPLQDTYHALAQASNS
jgi:hypothetical protein